MQGREGFVLLEDGRRFTGTYYGPERGSTGEIVFTTVHAGYHEVLTDPSFAGQIVVMTAPEMGVYGVRADEAQSRRPWVQGFVVRQLSSCTGNGPCDATLAGFLRQKDIPTLADADTRAITRHIREVGAVRALVAPAEMNEDEALRRLRAEPPMQGRDLASVVSTLETYELAPEGEERGLVLCLDYGVKTRSLDLLRGEGFRVRVLPAGTPVEEMLTAGARGVFVSNGPGDPEAVEDAPEKIRALSDAGLPIFGICLGHQLLARAFGAETFKLPYGHRGGNHPVLDLATGKVEITSQNHGFAVAASDDQVVDAPELRITHRNLNDGTVEGLAHRTRAAFGVQFHPEAAPGPHDSRHLFRRFVDAMSEMPARQAIDTPRAN